ncbi:MAG: YicC family protein [candidate division Zixibacteria bacterium]|nr:YicC family protein [candidate division Zixibacteria bacterium]
MNSMTGFGKAELKTKAGTFSVEIASVNNRFLDISPRLPRQFFNFEPKLRDLIKSKLNRGKVNLFVAFETTDEDVGRYAINSKAARAYFKQLQALRKELKLNRDTEMTDLLMLPGVSLPDREEIDEDLVWVGLKKACEKALVTLVAMRRKEGRAMARDMTVRLTSIAKSTEEIATYSSVSVEKYREKLNKRIAEVLNSAAPDTVRLEEEIAIMAERSDIAEECTRLASHIQQYRATLKQKEPVGKKLNFVLQEMNREINTIGAKSSELNISSLVIAAKEEIEKLRELVQNVE